MDAIRCGSFLEDLQKSSLNRQVAAGYSSIDGGMFSLLFMIEVQPIQFDNRGQVHCNIKYLFNLFDVNIQ